MRVEVVLAARTAMAEDVEVREIVMGVVVVMVGVDAGAEPTA